MALVGNMPDVSRKLDMYMDKAQDATLAHFRASVWAVFCRILDTTPQWSGRAVANWNIGVDAPDFSVNEQAGEDPTIQTAKGGGSYVSMNVQRVGSPMWIAFAQANNRHKLREIQRTSRVFICNGVTGDIDGGQSSENYLTSLQDPGYWHVKLREANKPYETAYEVIINESWRSYLPRGIRDVEAFT